MRQSSNVRRVAFHQCHSNACPLVKKGKKNMVVEKREEEERSRISPREIDKPDNFLSPVVCLEFSSLLHPFFLSSRNDYRMNGSFPFSAGGLDALLLSGDETILARRPAPTLREANSFPRELRRPGCTRAELFASANSFRQVLRRK